MSDLLTKNYVHAIGEVNDPETYNRLTSILNLGALYSRSKLDELKIKHKGANKYEINSRNESFYYTDDLHYEYISMHDPSNRFIQTAMNKSIELGCFSPTKIALFISKSITSSPFDETKGKDIGEVQVKGSISTEFITGIIIPNNDCIDTHVSELLIEKLNVICGNSGYLLPIFDYQGNILSTLVDKKERLQK